MLMKWLSRLAYSLDYDEGTLGREQEHVELNGVSSPSYGCKTVSALALTLRTCAFCNPALRREGSHAAG